MKGSLAEEGVHIAKLADVSERREKAEQEVKRLLATSGKLEYE